MQNAGLDEAQAGIRIAGRNISNLRYSGVTTLLSVKRREPVAEGEKAGLKLNIKKTKITASGTITSWQSLFLWAPKSVQTVTAAMKLKDTCSLEEKL